MNYSERELKDNEQHDHSDHYARVKKRVAGINIVKAHQAR